MTTLWYLATSVSLLVVLVLVVKVGKAERQHKLQNKDMDDELPRD